MDNEMFNSIMIDTQKEMVKSNKMKDRIIILLIVIVFLQSIIFSGIVIHMHNDNEYVETITTTTEDNSNVEVNTEGEGAIAEYVEGNQYNDNATHNVSN